MANGSGLGEALGSGWGAARMRGRRRRREGSMARRAVKEIAGGRVEGGRWWMWPRYGLLTRSLGRGEAGMMSGTLDDALWWWWW